MTKAKKKIAAKKRLGRKRPTAKPRPYVLPKTAAELNITCGDQSTGAKCGKPAIWFDYEIGEKNFYAGIVCDEHRVSNRVERLAV